MRKLRLIKPWRLRTIVQRLGDTDSMMPAQTAPCNGPQGDFEEACATRTTFIDLRVVKKIIVPFFAGVKAPHSDVIFVSECNQKKR